MDGTEQLLWVGSCPVSDGAGIHSFRLGTKDGALTPTGCHFLTANPSYLALDGVNGRLFAVGEREPGLVKSFNINQATGELRLINIQETGGKGTCHVTIDSQARVLLTANYGGASVSSLPVRPDGAIGPAASVIQHEGSGVVTDRQGEPHPHSMVLSPDERFVFAQDLGTDKITIYRLDLETAALTPNDPSHVDMAPGSGPRHLAFHPAGTRAYLINELANTVTGYAYDAERGDLSELQTHSALPQDFAGTSYCAEIRVHPSGMFLYGSNRGHDSVVGFSIEPDTGRLTLLGLEPTQGSFPRNFIIDSTGSFMIVANQKGDNIVVFSIDRSTGLLTPTGQMLDLPVPGGMALSWQR